MPPRRRATTCSRSSTAARSSGDSDSDVEADVEHVAVFDDVGLALEPLLAPARDLGVRAELDEVVPADHLAADEAACDVRADRRGGIDRRLAAAKRPRPRLLLASGEERDP